MYIRTSHVEETESPTNGPTKRAVSLPGFNGAASRPWCPGSDEWLGTQETGKVPEQGLGFGRAWCARHHLFPARYGKRLTSARCVSLYGAAALSRRIDLAAAQDVLGSRKMARTGRHPTGCRMANKRTRFGGFFIGKEMPTVFRFHRHKKAGLVGRLSVGAPTYFW